MDVVSDVIEQEKVINQIKDFSKHKIRTSTGHRIACGHIPENKDDQISVMIQL